MKTGDRVRVDKPGHSQHGRQGVVRHPAEQDGFPGEFLVRLDHSPDGVDYVLGPKDLKTIPPQNRT